MDISTDYIQTWQYSEHLTTSRVPLLDGWLLCGDFDPLNCEYEEQFKHYDELCNASSAEEGEVTSAVYFGKPLSEVAKNYNAWRKCKILFNNNFLRVLDAHIDIQRVLDKDSFEQLNIALVYFKLQQSYSSILDHFGVDFGRTLSSADGINMWYDIDLGHVCTIYLASSEVCREVLLRACSMVHKFREANRDSIARKTGNTTWTRDPLKSSTPLVHQTSLAKTEKSLTSTRHQALPLSL